MRKDKETVEGGAAELIISFFRTVILYVIIIVSLRIMGKRQLGELEPSELVVTILISDLAAVPMQDLGMPLLGGVLSILTLVAMELLSSFVIMRSVKMREIICGRPVMIVADGAPLQDEMRKNRYTIDELMENLRQNNVTELSTVKYAILETSGQLSVILRAADQPATASQLGVEQTESGIATIVINDGRILRDNLNRLGLPEDWLGKELKKRGVQRASEVFLMSVDESGSVEFIKREGRGT